MPEDPSPHVIVVVPIYKPELTAPEERALDHSLRVLSRHDVCFVAPAALVLDTYRRRWPQARFLACPDEYFTSAQAYSRLLLGVGFYQYFASYSHMLVVQTDAIVLRDELDRWTATPFDYVGAPWPKHYSITLPELDNGFSKQTFIMTVGNGGFSLRRIAACIEALRECGWVLEKTPMDEDLFFGLCGQISQRFVVPNAVTAACFALEADPRRYRAMTGVVPMGGHAWEKWDKAFWLEQLAGTTFAEPPVATETRAPADPRTGALFRSGLVAQEAGKVPEAAEIFRRVLAVEPTHWMALYSLCVIELNASRFEPALAYVDRAVAAEPGSALLHFARGRVLHGLKRVADSIAAYDQALALRPDYPEAINNRAALLSDLNRLDEALEAYDGLLAMHPDNTQALGNRGMLLTLQGRNAEAVPCFVRLLKLDPDFRFGDGLLAHARARTCDWTDFKKLRRRIIDGVRAGRKSCNSLAFMSLSDSAEEHFLCARIFAADMFPPAPRKLWNGERYRHERLRIAYLSPDFREHPVAHLVAGVLAHHDRQRFETFGFSLGIDDGSELRRRIAGSLEHFADVRPLSPLQIAEQIREQEIDILVDLAGFTKDARVDILSWRPAPVQVNWLGYPGTMGCDYYDYILADRHVIPAADEAFYAERVIRLPGTYLPSDDSLTISEGSATREAAGLPGSGIVFCCFNHEYKINPDLYDVWMRLLKKIPGSVLWLMKLNDTAARNLAKEAKKRGIDPARLVFAERVPRVEDHLARYRLADLFLDTTPYNAHSTASDVLRSGLPLVTCAGRSFPSRVAASLLHLIDMPELITGSLPDYEELALGLARDPARLTAIRERLRANVAGMRFDSAEFCRGLEAAYERCAPFPG